MDEQIKEWLLEMYNAEIVQEEGTIKNEQAWADGAVGMSKGLHMANVTLHKSYLAELRRRRDAIANGEER